MMRAVVLAVTLCLAGVLAGDKDTYIPGVYNAPLTPGSKDHVPIAYYIKNTTNYHPTNGPIFYGIAGRVPVESIKSQYDLFDFVHNDYFNAVVVYAEQRFFGRSKLNRINSASDLATLTLDTVVNDHVALIKQLAKEHNTKNVLVFGGGHGGTIAGYVANKFATDTTDKELKDYNVLGWISSSPNKYLTPFAATDGSQLHDVGKQIAALMNEDGDAVCTAAEAVNLHFVFKKIKELFSAAAGGDAGDTFISALHLLPKPVLKTTTATEPSSDQKELVVYLRKRIIDLAFDSPYKADGTKNERKLVSLCKLVKPVTTVDLVTADVVNSILNLLGASATVKLQWKLTDDGTGRWNQDLAAATYQDCTDYQIAYCAESSDPADAKGDPLAGSHYDQYAANQQACITLDAFKTSLKAECDGIFGAGGPDASKYTTSTFPASLKNRVVTTYNSRSVFGKSVFTDANDKDVKNFATYIQLQRTDNWEFQASRDCDSDQDRSVRYLVLRAFGCLGKFAAAHDATVDACKEDKLFDDGTPASDNTLPATCAPKTSKDDAKYGFPFSHAPLDFHNPDQTTAPPVPTKASTNPPSGQSTTVAYVSTTGSGNSGNGFIPSTIVVLSSAMLVWFTAL